MLQSLKSVLPDVARVLGETPVVLYERQLSLMRGGLLESRPGRGPGSGVRATAESIALLLIAALIDGSASDLSKRVKIIAATRPGFARGAKCKLTGAATFEGALATVLVDEKLSTRVTSISVFVAGGLAQIYFDDNDQSPFVGPGPKWPVPAYQHGLGAGSIHALTKVVSALLSKDDEK